MKCPLCTGNEIKSLEIVDSKQLIMQYQALTGGGALFIKGHDKLSMVKIMVIYCYDNEKQVCNSFPYFREEI